MPEPGVILVADDDRVSRSILVQSMKRHGHVVTEVDDGAQALDAFSCWRIPEILEFPRPPARSFMAVYRENFMAADTLGCLASLELRLWRLYLPRRIRGGESCPARGLPTYFRNR
jgi:hypothetical protein